MNKYRTIKKYVLALMLAIVLLKPTEVFAATPSGGFSDEEISEDASIETSTLDMEMRSGQGNFVNSDDLFRGDTTTRDVYVKNVGNTDFKYKSFVELKSGTDTALCGNLELKVWYNWYDSTKHMEPKYNGTLADFEINFDGGDAELQIPNAHEYVTNGFYSNGEHWFYYRIQVPESADYDLSQKTCEFKIKTIAWQAELDDESQGFWDEEEIDASVTTGDWAPKPPTGITILNHRDEDIGCGGVTNNRSITVDWDDSTEFDLDHYDYGIKDVDVHDDYVENSERPGTIRDQDGDYKYKVRAVDEEDNISEWSEWCHLTLDRTIDDAEEREVIINEIMWSGSSKEDSDEWIELYNDTTREIKLKNWEIAGAGSGEDSIILPAGATISPGGYYLIANYSDSDSNSSLGVTVDFVTTTLDLSDGGEDLQLIDAFENVIDRAGTSTGWLAGEIEEEIEEEEDSGKWRSMERNDIPGDGTDSGDWHTCTDDVCNDDTYWDSHDGNDYGTPGSENHSENDPTSEDKEEKLEIPVNTTDPEEGPESEPADILGAAKISQTDLPVLIGTTEEEEGEEESPPAEEEEENQEPEISPEDSQSTEEENTEEEAVENAEEEPIIEGENTDE